MGPIPSAASGVSSRRGSSAGSCAGVTVVAEVPCCCCWFESVEGEGEGQLDCDQDEVGPVRQVRGSGEGGIRRRSGGSGRTGVLADEVLGLVHDLESKLEESAAGGWRGDGVTHLVERLHTVSFTGL